MPGGTFSAVMVTRVPAVVRSNDQVMVISPANEGSSDSKSTVWTMRRDGSRATNRPWLTSVRLEVLPPPNRAIAAVGQLDPVAPADAGMSTDARSVRRCSPAGVMPGLYRVTARAIP
jgi:hypothetical protein